jgi:hypothetical protein
MAEKLVHKISPIGAENANYLAIEHIKSGVVESGDAVLVFPGDYSNPNTANVSNMSITGMGKRDDVVFNGFTIPAAATGTITLKGLKIASPGLSIGNTTATINVIDCIISGAASLNRASSLAMGNAAITKGVAGATYAVVANSTLVVEDCEFPFGTAYAIAAHDYGTVTVRNSVVKTDGGLFSNGAATLDRVTFTGANNYMSTAAAAITAPAITVYNSYAPSATANANVGNNSQTVIARII